MLHSKHVYVCMPVHVRVHVHVHVGVQTPSQSVGMQGGVSEEIQFAGRGGPRGSISSPRRGSNASPKGGAVNLRGSVGNLASPTQVPPLPVQPSKMIAAMLPDDGLCTVFVLAVAVHWLCTGTGSALAVQ